MYNNDDKIKYTNDAFIYRSERHSDNTFTYDLPLKGPDTYTLILKFVEVFI